MKAIVHFDGASLGNPGPMGAGATLEVDGDIESLELPLGKGTNNEAEYHGAILGLRHALAAGADEVELRGDSQLVIRQLEGKYQVRADNLVALHAEAKALLRKFAKVKLTWIPREKNVGADAASMAAALRAKGRA